ncbi:MAG TPA: hypothetical protein VFC03_02740 [Acidimicrobiales bacterium]|nr:hypothetical protein [Acidimicrobiales bacterium]
MSDLRQIKKHVNALLDGLGKSPDEVAASLHAAGVQGVPKSNSSCAIALYAAALMKADPRVRSVAVGPCSLMINLAKPRDSRPGGRLSVQLPKPVRGFVAAFDARQYPMVVRDQSADLKVPSSIARG